MEAGKEEGNKGRKDLRQGKSEERKLKWMGEKEKLGKEEKTKKREGQEDISVMQEGDTDERRERSEGMEEGKNEGRMH